MSKKEVKFEENEKILCYHGPILYNAKCVKIDSTNEEARYRVHYDGWNKNWDEWVDESRILKVNDQNLQLQEKIREEYSVPKKKSKKENETERNVEIKRSKQKEETKRKSKESSEIEIKEEFSKKNEVFLPIPEILRKQLADDWEYVKKQKKLVKLPRKPTVSEILEDFRKSKVKGYNNDVLTLVVEGVKSFFDEVLGLSLLYRFERADYMNVLQTQKGLPMSDVYGAEHLLRLFGFSLRLIKVLNIELVKLPSLLVDTDIDEKSMKTLISHLQDFLQYMETNHPTLFINNYQTATPDYCRLVENS